MSNTVISVESLSKRYLVGHSSENQGHKRYIALRDVIGREARNIARKTVDLLRDRQILQGDEIEEFWALKDVSFEVEKGEVLGIIGRNGAGKSTLLKILSRITEPTEGRVTINGRVASLLEVGTGFHPELTGRENIYLNGAILGMTRREIARKFDEIVAFAEVEKFLDTPVKRYSSGMYVRLAFAVAAHLEPEILIVDEVLAVGDAEFQRKCLGKMDQVSRREGRTVLFVSHNMGVVTNLCPTAIWLDGGSIRERGAANDIIRDYLSRGALNRDRIIPLKNLPRQSVEGNELRLQSIEWRCDVPLRHGEEVRARISLETRDPVANVAVGIGFCDLTGKRILSYDTDLQDGYRPNLARSGIYTVDVVIDALPLQPDTYVLDIGCRSGDSYLVDYIPAALQLEVLAGPRTPGFISHHYPIVRLPSRWTWNLRSSPRASTDAGNVIQTADPSHGGVAAGRQTSPTRRR
jgi:lipopolysaccharide transport system ATP-binding protein